MEQRGKRWKQTAEKSLSNCLMTVLKRLAAEAATISSGRVTEWLSFPTQRKTFR